MDREAFWHERGETIAIRDRVHEDDDTRSVDLFHVALDRPNDLLVAIARKNHFVEFGDRRRPSFSEQFPWNNNVVRHESVVDRAKQPSCQRLFERERVYFLSEDVANIQFIKTIWGCGYSEQKFWSKILYR